ncbi:conserved hypothetical protein [Burkholderia diffusa]|nr:conserved hypothetical protein [Burkholderia diffusa]
MLRDGIFHDIAETIKWVWYMTHENQYGHNGVHLEPGKEYYIPAYASTFDESYYPVKPVSAEVAELTELVGIGVVRSDQKIDHEIEFKRIRSPYAISKSVAELGVVVNGDYFFSIAPDGDFGGQITIDEAVRAPSYIKITLYLQKVIKAEKVDRIGEWRNRFTYWPTTNFRKEQIGYRIEDGQRTDWHDCYAESNGAHTQCPDEQKRP